MAKKKKQYTNDIEFLTLAEAQHPEEYAKANICSTKAIDAIEGYAAALRLQSDLTFVLYWLQVTTYANLVMDGLTEQITGKKK